jgi:hypothetical protein
MNVVKKEPIAHILQDMLLLYLREIMSADVVSYQSLKCRGESIDIPTSTAPAVEPAIIDRRLLGCTTDVSIVSNAEA